jgi:hypothetical protein
MLAHGLNRGLFILGYHCLLAIEEIRQFIPIAIGSSPVRFYASPPFKWWASFFWLSLLAYNRRNSAVHPDSYRELSGTILC